VITGRFLTAANLLSISRVPLAVAAAMMLLDGNIPLTGVFMVLATATDWLDGVVARKTGTVSDWGRILDPAADKAAFLVMAIALLKAGLIQPWILWMLVVRDGLIAAGGFLMSRKFRPPSSNLWGKAATTALAFYMIKQALLPEIRLPGGEMLFGTDLLGLLAAFLVTVSFATYIFVFFRTNRETNAS
jgi:CDP-diacylglycerol--glycerol-3-phosphate 3-phosphatidyltransferase